ncbi:hypothetical protein ABW19_dt0201098 [Dactylella cylindrospora]|nr:hypothetical protein ABW19_dt0201098 [Dactylella cylindrospora]
MLERKRQAKTSSYHVVGNEEAELGIIEEEDEEEDEAGPSGTGKVSSSTGPQINGETSGGK